METVDVLEYTALTLTLLLHLSGIIPCLKMSRTGSCQHVPFHIFVLAMLSCSGMLQYSLLIGHGSLFYLNLIGLMLYIMYLGFYLYCTTDKEFPFMLLSSAVAIELGFMYYLYIMAVEKGDIIEALGISLTCINLCLMLLPSLELLNNLINKNSEGMPLVMIITNLLCSSSWLAYGLYLEDFYVYFPNIPGLSLLSLKLLVHILYPGKTKAE